MLIWCRADAYGIMEMYSDTVLKTCMKMHGCSLNRIRLIGSYRGASSVLVNVVSLIRRKTADRLTMGEQAIIFHSRSATPKTKNRARARRTWNYVPP